jgi:DNA-binding transcriptional MerR regulator
MESAMQELPRKDLYKLSEVCRYTDTQPYVLRFWESEFPQLKPGKSASGQRLYRKRDIDVVCRIRELLYEEDYTLEGARKKLANELAGGKRVKSGRGASGPAAAPKASATPPAKMRPALGIPHRTISDSPPAVAANGETVSRQRYEDAVDEIDHLRLALKEAEKSRRRAESEAQEAREIAERERGRAEKAVGHLERVYEILS